MSAAEGIHWVEPTVLRGLREQAGFQYEQVEQLARQLQKAHYAPVTQKDLEQWEKGLASPALEHLETLAEVYGYPVGYFFLRELPQLPFPLSYRGLAEGKESCLSPHTRRTLRRFLRLTEWIAFLIEEHGIDWQTTLPPPVTASPEELAWRERERLGFSEEVRRQWVTADEAFQWWRQRIEAQGVFVLEMTLEPGEVRGASLWVSARFPFILVNHQDAEAATGRLFTLLHEYAHLLRHQDGVTCDFRGSGQEGQGMESFANRFAARMLLPPQEFVQSLQEAGKMRFKKNWSDAELDELRSRFFVSRDVVAIALQELGLSPSDLYQRKRQRWENRKPWGRARKPVTKKERKARELGWSLVRVLVALQQKDALPVMDVSSALDLKVEQVSEFLEWARSELSPEG